MLRYLKNLEFQVITRHKQLILYEGNRELRVREDWTNPKLLQVIEKSKIKPQKVAQVGNRDFWVYEERWYSSTKDLEPDEVEALLKASAVRSKQTIDRAKSLASAKSSPLEAKRGQIPSDLRLLIWAKYEGSCADCGSSSELQFDHIIPVAMGGATSEENLQILCGSCNRSKGASLG